MNARQQSILQMVIDKGRMSVADLAKMTGVSEVTIRQDLNLLEKQSYLRRPMVSPSRWIAKMSKPA
jgi:DeoR/GlpR family transcriptional regulator of sugar metabolism